MADFFISYQHDSMDFATELKRIIEENGIPCWMDPLIDGGDEWKLVIDNAIISSVGVIVVVTPLAQKSQYVTYEWSFGLGLGKKVIPVLLENVERLHPKLSDIQYRNFTNPNDRDWTQLINDLRKIREQLHLPAPVASAQNALRTSHRKEDWINAFAYLAETPYQAAFGVLADETRNLESFISVEAALLLAQKSDYTDRRAVPRLCQALDDTVYIQKAARAIGKLGSKEALDCLLARFEMLSDDPTVVEIFTRAIANTKEPAAAIKLATLIRLDTPTNVNVMIAALEGLRDLANPATLPDLLKFIELKNYPDWRIIAVNGIGRIGGIDAIQGLRNFVNKMQRAESPDNVRVFTVAIGTLGEIGNEETLQFLQEFSNIGTYIEVRKPALEAIKKLTQKLAT